MEFLKNKLNEDSYNKVIELLGDIKVLPNDGSYIPIGKFNNVNEENKVLKEKITHFETNAKDVESIIGSNNELKAQFNALQEKHNKDIESKDKEINNIIKKNTLKEMLLNEKAIYPDLLLTQIDLDAVNVVDGKAQFDIAGIKDKYSNMFQQSQVEPIKINDLGERPSVVSKKQQLVERYNNAEKAGNTIEMLSIQNQIKSIEK